MVPAPSSACWGCPTGLSDTVGAAVLWFTLIPHGSERPPLIDPSFEVRMRADNDDPRKQVARLLRRRPGWTLQAMATPGAPVVWCFGSGNEFDLSVTADPDSILVYVKGTDQAVKLGSVNELVAWLQTHRAGSLLDRRTSVLDKLRGGTLFKWE